MTVTPVDPTGDVSTAGVSLTGGASVTAVTADASDATYATATVDLATARVDLGTVTVAANTRIKSVQATVRSQTGAGSSTPNKPTRVNVRFIDPNNTSLAPAGSTDITAYGTAATYSASKATTGPGGQAWSQSLLNRLQLEIVWYVSGSGLTVGYQRVIKLQASVETNARPVAGTPAITGTATSRPSWSATFTDADGDGQVRAQVRVFSQAQTVAVGFSADTTMPVWDSGVLTGAVKSGQVGTDLYAGTNYVLYWRAAQSWPDSTGVWWSAWAASAPFATLVSPPPAPSVVPAARPEVPAASMVLTVTAPMDGTLTTAGIEVERGDRFDAARGPAKNWAPPQIASGGAELLSTDGWAATGSGDVVTFEPVTVPWPEPVGAAGCIHWQPKSGTVGYLLGGGGVNPDDAPGRYQSAVVAGAQHVLSLWAWAGASFSAKLAISFLDGALNPVGSVVIGPTVSLGTSPARYILAATAPAGAVFAYGGLQNAASASTGDVWTTRFGWGLGGFPVDDHPGAAGDVAWVPVRRHGAGDSIPTAAGSPTAVALDREAPPARPVIYRVRIAGTFSGNPVTSNWSTYVSAYLPAPAQAVLKDPLTPALAATVNELDGHDRQQEEDATEFHLAGDDGNTVVLRDWVGGLDGKLALFAASFADLRRLRALYPSSRTLLLQHPEGGQTYMRFRDRRESPRLMASGLHTVDLSYVECARP